MVGPQFGAPVDGLIYADRPAAFGLAVKNGLIALVEVKKPRQAAWVDLPGGAIDGDETAQTAVEREFGEETGLLVAADEPFAFADQRFRNTDGAAFNNRGVFFQVEVHGEDAGLKIEVDHTLIWLRPEAALRRLRHEAHAWAVTAWMRL
ncbi:NUDIX domain-containing protein [Phenylobacterium immobile]|uniref:NUDIX domain-containing protein n=1 Tax=Phenylobacterium immobile TaxID=21 RepID=UPI000B0F4725|nr:NUDIX domain-containing protein [Phenylobacterium immobile]